MVPYEAKILYLCVALATEAGYRITKEEFVGCSEVSPSEALHILNRNLKDIVITSGLNEELLLLRHRAIAEYAIDQFAARVQLREAYIRLLRVLSLKVTGKSWRSRSFGFYKNLINHANIYKRFEENFDEARSIYNELSSKFKGDAQFWLQYGSLELEAGQLQYAENYLNAAESLDRNNFYIKNAHGHLFLRKACSAETKSEGIKFRNQGSKILLESINNSDIKDPYCYHIYANQRHLWMKKWVASDQEKKDELENLRDILSNGVREFPRNRRIFELTQQIEEEYLSMAVVKS